MVWIGWQLRGYDLSKYAGIRFEMEQEVFEDHIHITLNTFTKDEEMNFKFAPNGVCYVFFNGVGQAWGNIAEPKPEEGFEINIYAHKNVYPKIKFTSIELIKTEDVGNASNLSIMGKPFGSFTNNALCIGNEITWPKGTTDGKCGWDLTGIDLSEYDRIRIELESSDIVVLPRMIDESWNNWHGFDDCRVGPNTWEFNLTGDDASWKNDGTVDFDKSKGMKIFLQLWTDNKPTEQEYKTTVKSVQLLKGKKNENLNLPGALFGSTRRGVYAGEDGNLEWVYDENEAWPWIGWRVENVDLSAYKKIRIEIEASDIPLRIRLIQDGCNVHVPAVSENILEANLDGSDGLYPWPEGAEWDSSKKLREIHITVEYPGVTVNSLKAKIKSVTLLP